MTGGKNAWLLDKRHMLAANHILDAASTLFAARGDVDGVGVQEIAAAAGCSRTTLYRYFPTREDLYLAYAHRETRRVIREVGRRIDTIDDPHERLTEGIIQALTMVRESPPLAAWFARRAPLGSEIADESDVVTGLMASYLRASGAVGEDIETRARWLVRNITSLLLFPEVDSETERHIASRFIVPVVLSDNGTALRGQRVTGAMQRGIRHN